MGFTREDVTFRSRGDDCAAWLYRPEGVENPPVIVMCHGLGAIREMRLNPFGEAFAEAGFAALAFTYRFFGDSGGEPRQWLDVERQQEDIETALRFVRKLPGVDHDRVALWGTSFGGGHVMEAARRDGKVKAMVAQCPFTDGMASGFTLGLASTIKVAVASIADNLLSLVGRGPIYIGLSGSRGDAALMTAPDVVEGMNRLDEGIERSNDVTARTALRISLYRPGFALRDVKCPSLVCVCEKDSVAPAAVAAKFVNAAPNAQLKSYPIGHFDIYYDEGFQIAIKDQIAFLKTHLAASDR